MDWGWMTIHALGIFGAGGIAGNSDKLSSQNLTLDYDHQVACDFFGNDIHRA